jgi:hypothetical protein
VSFEAPTGSRPELLSSEILDTPSGSVPKSSSGVLIPYVETVLTLVVRPDYRLVIARTFGEGATELIEAWRKILTFIDKYVVVCDDTLRGLVGAGAVSSLS